MKYYTCTRVEVAGRARAGRADRLYGRRRLRTVRRGKPAPALWNALLEAGKSEGLEPAGLGARDMLRLEAGMPLYGFDRTPQERADGAVALGDARQRLLGELARRTLAHVDARASSRALGAAIRPPPR